MKFWPLHVVKIKLVIVKLLSLERSDFWQILDPVHSAVLLHGGPSDVRLAEFVEQRIDNGQHDGDRAQEHRNHERTTLVVVFFRHSTCKCCKSFTTIHEYSFLKLLSLLINFQEHYLYEIFSFLSSYFLNKIILLR